MKENFIKAIQKFVKGYFTYEESKIFFDKQKDFLLKEEVINNLPDIEYNSLWDTVLDLERKLSYANRPNLIIAIELDVEKLYIKNRQERNLLLKLK